MELSDPNTFPLIAIVNRKLSKYDYSDLEVEIILPAAGGLPYMPNSFGKFITKLMLALADAMG
jgi:hypothetical protein